MKKVIGFRGVIDSIKKGIVTSITIDPYKRSHERVREVLRMAKGIDVRWERVDKIIEAEVHTATCDFKEELEKLAYKETSLVLALDCIQDVGNLGAIIRSSDAFNVDLIIMPNKRSVKVNDVAIKISAGSYANVKIIEVPNLVDALKDLQRAGFWIYGSASSGDKSYRDCFSEKTCIVMGNESKGLRKKTEENCDFLVKIPISDKVDSLNVANACSILLCEAFNFSKK